MTGFPLPAPVAVGGEWCTLRPFAQADVHALRTMAEDPELRRWNPLSRGDGGVDAWVAKRAVWDDHMSWAVVDEGDAILGGVSLWLFDGHNASASIGYWTAPAHRGRGVAVTATGMATRFAFAHTPIERLTLCHAVENTASCAVARRAGFPLEGTTRKSWRYQDDLLHDEHVHAVLRSDLP